MTKQAALDILESLFAMPPPRRAKCETLYQLAQQAPDTGAIVELGTFHGCGAIALALGCDGMVYTVDDFAERRGWANEPYGPEDKATFRRNVRTANVDVMLVKGAILQVERDWTRPISLLFWDLGMPNRLHLDFWAWQKHVVIGGKIAMHDTLGESRLGAADVAADATGSGRFRFVAQMPGGVWVVERIR